MEVPPTHALRARDPEAFRAELRALLLADPEGWERDGRDLLVALAPFHDCARRLGLDVVAELDAAVADGPPTSPITSGVRTPRRRDRRGVRACPRARSQRPALRQAAAVVTWPCRRAAGRPARPTAPHTERAPDVARG